MDFFSEFIKDLSQANTSVEQPADNTFTNSMVTMDTMPTSYNALNTFHVQDLESVGPVELGIDGMGGSSQGLFDYGDGPMQEVHGGEMQEGYPGDPGAGGQSLEDLFDEYIKAEDKTSDQGGPPDTAGNSAEMVEEDLDAMAREVQDILGEVQHAHAPPAPATAATGAISQQWGIQFPTPAPRPKAPRPPETTKPNPNSITQLIPNTNAHLYLSHNHNFTAPALNQPSVGAATLPSQDMQPVFHPPTRPKRRSAREVSRTTHALVAEMIAKRYAETQAPPQATSAANQASASQQVPVLSEQNTGQLRQHATYNRGTERVYGNTNQGISRQSERHREMHPEAQFGGQLESSSHVGYVAPVYPQQVSYQPQANYMPTTHQPLNSNAVAYPPVGHESAAYVSAERISGNRSSRSGPPPAPALDDSEVDVFRYSTQLSQQPESYGQWVDLTQENTIDSRSSTAQVPAQIPQLSVPAPAPPAPLVQYTRTPHLCHRCGAPQLLTPPPTPKRRANNNKQSPAKKRRMS